MQLTDVLDSGAYDQGWPGTVAFEAYPASILYRAVDAAGEHTVRIAVNDRTVYGRPRRHVLVLLDDYPEAQFVGADDFATSGEVLTYLKLAQPDGLREIPFPAGEAPDSYAGMPVVGAPTRLTGPNVHQTWAVAVPIGEHPSFARIAGLRRAEKRQRATDRAQPSAHPPLDDFGHLVAG